MLYGLVFVRAHVVLTVTTLVALNIEASEYRCPIDIELLLQQRTMPYIVHHTVTDGQAYINASFNVPGTRCT